MGVNLDLGVDKGWDPGCVASPHTVIGLTRDYRLHDAIRALAEDCDYEVEWPNEETGAGNWDGPGQYVLAGDLKNLDLDEATEGCGTSAWNRAALALLATLDEAERVYLCWG